jgi:hypothetical protein
MTDFYRGREIMGKNKVSILIFISLMCATLHLYAQTNLNFTTYLIRDNNVFKIRETYEEWVNKSSCYIGHRFAAENFYLQAYYNADILVYANNVDLNNYANKFGIRSSFYNDEYSLYLNIFAKLHRYNEQFIYYSEDEYNANVNLQYSPNLKNFYSLEFTINQEKYKEFGDLDNLSYRFYIEYQHFFQRKLSLSCNASLGTKNYVNQSVIQYFGMGIDRIFPRYREDPVKAAIFSASGNIGKSITSHLGLSVGFGGQWFIGDPIMSYLDGIYYYTENDLYDDPYSYQDRYMTFQLTRQFAVGFQGKFGLKYQIKDYAGTPALDEFGNLTGEMRQDIRSEYFLTISKNFKTSWKFPKSIGLFFNFMYRKNPSNDPYYEFNDHIGLAGISVSI